MIILDEFAIIVLYVFCSQFISFSPPMLSHRSKESLSETHNEFTPRTTNQFHLPRNTQFTISRQVNQLFANYSSDANADAI